jgi:hypothetical protein
MKAGRKEGKGGGTCCTHVNCIVEVRLQLCPAIAQSQRQPQFEEASVAFFSLQGMRGYQDNECVQETLNGIRIFQSSRS